MRRCAWLAMLLSTLFVLYACEKEQPAETPPPPAQTETAPPPAQQDMQAPAESATPAPPTETEQAPTAAEPSGDTSYTTPAEGEKQGMQNLEVVDKNISEATDQPSAIASAEAGSGPQTVTFEARNGNVTFNHQQHATMEDCTACHEQTPPQKLELNQESAHALCRGCHQDRGAGPVKCTDCHKKE